MKKKVTNKSKINSNLVLHRFFTHSLNFTVCLKVAFSFHLKNFFLNQILVFKVLSGQTTMRTLKDS